MLRTEKCFLKSPTKTFQEKSTYMKLCLKKMKNLIISFHTHLLSSFKSQNPQLKMTGGQLVLFYSKYALKVNALLKVKLAMNLFRI